MVGMLAEVLRQALDHVVVEALLQHEGRFFVLFLLTVFLLQISLVVLPYHEVYSVDFLLQYYVITTTQIFLSTALVVPFGCHPLLPTFRHYFHDTFSQIVTITPHTHIRIILI